MDDTIAGKHISCDNIRGTAVVFDLNTTATLLKGDLLFAKGGDIAIPHCSGRNQGADNMGEDNFFGLFCRKALQGSCWKFGESSVSWSKNGHSSCIPQSLFQAEVLDKFHQSFKAACANSCIDQVWFWLKSRPSAMTVAWGSQCHGDASGCKEQANGGLHFDIKWKFPFCLNQMICKFTVVQ